MENIDEWITELKRSGKTIIVEGPNDKKALEHFGINNIVTLSRHPLYKITEDVAASAKDVIILTDFDREGRQLYGRLSTGLQRMGVRIDNKFREFLFRQRLSHIEGLVTFVRNNGTSALYHS